LENRNPHAHLNLASRHARCSRWLRTATMKTEEGRSALTQAARRIVAPASPVRLPHEEDESSRQPGAAPAREMKKAHHDITAGLVDTDERGVTAGRAFRRAFGGKAKTASAATVTAKKRKRARP